MIRRQGRQVHIWTDASVKGKRAAGAFVVGKNPPEARPIRAKTSIRAELETMVIALEQMSDCQHVTIHTDLTTIFNLIYGRRTWKELEALRIQLDRLRVTIMIDAWDYIEYRRCHRAARAMLKLS